VALRGFGAEDWIVVVSTCLENSWSSISSRGFGVQGRGRVEVPTLYFRPRLDPGEYYGEYLFEIG